jgi:hypothetical protein
MEQSRDQQNHTAARWFCITFYKTDYIYKSAYMKYETKDGLKDNIFYISVICYWFGLQLLPM